MTSSAQRRRCLPIWLFVQQYLVPSSYSHLAYNFWWLPFAETSHHVVLTLQGLMGIVFGLAQQRLQLRLVSLTQQFNCWEGGSHQPLPPTCDLLSNRWLPYLNFCPNTSNISIHVCLSLSIHISSLLQFSAVLGFPLCVCSTKLFIVHSLQSCSPLLNFIGFGECWCYTPLEDFMQNYTPQNVQYLVYVGVGIIDDKHIVTETFKT